MERAKAACHKAKIFSKARYFAMKIVRK